MAVVVEPFEKEWYDFATGLLSILGGVFAMARFSTEAATRMTGSWADSL